MNKKYSQNDTVPFMGMDSLFIKIARKINMKRIIAIEGMTCGHCQARVEKALNSVEGVKAKVDLKKNSATVEADSTVSDALLKKTVEEAGYTVTSIEEKKGLFGR